MTMNKSAKNVLFLTPLVIFIWWQCSKQPPLDPFQTGNDNFVVLAQLDAEPKNLHPGENAKIIAVLLDNLNRPVAGKKLEFTASKGILNPTVSVTNDSGQAVTQFTAPDQPGSVVITARLEDSQTRSINLEIQDPASQRATIVPEDSSILANGISSTKIRTVWLDQQARPLKNVEIRFETTAGQIVPALVLTDSSGLAVAELFSIASDKDTVAQVSAHASGETIQTQVRFRGISFALTASPQELVADGRSTATITALLKETTSTFAIPGAEITFGTTLGTIPKTGVTNESGVLQINLTSAPDTGMAKVTAVYGKTFAKVVEVHFTESRPTYLDLSANPPVILADNQSTSTLTAKVSDQANNPVPDGTPVLFEIIEGSGTIESNKVTNAGIATSTLTSSLQPDTVTIVARVGSLTDTTLVRYVVGEPATLTLTSDSTSLPADGQTSTRLIATVFDAAGNPVEDGIKVSFVTNIGQVTPFAQTKNGQAVAQFSSSQTGVATVTASVGNLSDEVTIKLRPGPPNSILLSFDPNSLGVKDSGRNQTVTITARVVDSKNNPVEDGTLVKFSIFSSPGGGEFLSTTDPVPTLNGQAQVSFNSGIRSGAVRIMAQVTDAQGNPVVPEVRAISTELIIFAGPPYIEDVNNPSSSHLSVGVMPLNVLGWGVVNNTAIVTAVVGDKFNNPVPPGTAVFFTTTGGVISTHTGFTNEEGVASVIIHTAQPFPTVTRYHNTFFDPNEDHPDFNRSTNQIPGLSPDYEGGEVVNSMGDTGENDGVARILAVTEGVDANGHSARVWAVTDLVFSGAIQVFEITVSDTALSPGESAIVSFKIYDVNGNPIAPGSEISIQASEGELSWTSLTTGDPGVTHYQVLLTNNLDPTDPDARATTTTVNITVNSPNGNLIKSSTPINLNLN